MKLSVTLIPNKARDGIIDSNRQRNRFNFRVPSSVFQTNGLHQNEKSSDATK